MLQPSKNKKRPDTPLAPTPTLKWADDIRNPDNEEFVEETRFNKKNNSKVTQKEFNQRYKIK